MDSISTIAFLNNPISAALAQQDLRARGIALSEVGLILGRRFDVSWAAECGRVLHYPAPPSGTMWGQRHFAGYYRAAASFLRKAGGQGVLRHLYTVNNDNLISSHMLSMKRINPALTMTVVAEGLMNFQDIGLANRAGWRWHVKPLAARLLGFDYRPPSGHLSGAFEPEIDRVVSFSGEGLKAPAEKISIIPFERAMPSRAADPGTALIALTGLAHWMTPDRFEPFAHAFIEWVKAQNFRKIQVKRHPHVSAGLIEELLPPHEEIGRGLSLEDMAPDLEAGTILGTCCTGLVTLKLMRPDLRCVDFGADYYCEHAYHGDRSVETLLKAAGVEIRRYSRS